MDDLLSVLERHAARRAQGVSTVSVLVGPAVLGRRLWRRWAAAAGRATIPASAARFPIAEWLTAATSALNLAGLALRDLARRAGRDPMELAAAWPTKTAADREQFWQTIAPGPADDAVKLLTEPTGGRPVAAVLTAVPEGLGESLVRDVTDLGPTQPWPSVEFATGSTAEMTTIAAEAARWAERVPAVPVAILVSHAEWDDYLATAPDSRARAILREGTVLVPRADPVEAERRLTAAGIAPASAAALAACFPDPSLVDAATAVAAATDPPPESERDDDRARSAAERFLYGFLESLPETAGRFQLNGVLDFRFGSRPAEADLLCRDPAVVVEIDGYYHFLGPDRYRRDRAKDWELQRRGYLVLRFLAEDTVARLEMVRDRILAALARTSPGDT